MPPSASPPAAPSAARLNGTPDTPTLPARKPPTSASPSFRAPASAAPRGARRAPCKREPFASALSCGAAPCSRDLPRCWAYSRGSSSDVATVSALYPRRRPVAKDLRPDKRIKCKNMRKAPPSSRHCSSLWSLCATFPRPLRSQRGILQFSRPRKNVVRRVPRAHGG
ncbi:KLTH0G01430p [Lachancea thermotolerans CBS 6340]|uniref:KLTH0G01430p n=1 Tax=Lachancea thermotolerans (strain ATCC 56472 / CBS 6340 / NRRL Y-8284) TaxID=559295 RepID=C5DLK5_LACTC|nr:KLTH0G01430p [Lachancea thermotolerans CBS 6340]CAR24666.1 KLTH0G01430p [Lachancea thermotolerans CBS 6340]